MPDRIRQELIEADVEQGFSLVDMAEEEAVLGNYEGVSRIVQAAERVLQDIEQRLAPLQDIDAYPFRPLVGELRRAIESARSHIPDP
jgi:hypothetical protein